MKIKIQSYLPFAFTFIWFAINCSAADVDLTAERKAVLQADAEWAKAASDNNMEKLWEFWAADAKLLMTADFSVSGIEAIKAFTKRSRKDPNFHITWKAQGGEVSPDGKMAYSYGVGTVTRTGADGKAASQSKPYLIVWRKQDDGSWKCVIEN